MAQRDFSFPFRIILSAFVFVASLSNGRAATELEPVLISNWGSTGFCLRWNEASNAAGYVVNVWSNGVVGARSGERIIDEHFSGLESRGYRLPWAITEINRLGDYGRWNGELIRGYPSEEGEEVGVVLGTETACGWLLSNPLPSGEFLVQLRLTRHTRGDTVPLLVAFVKNGATNFFSRITLSTEVHRFADYSFKTPSLPVGCQLLLSTQSRASGTFGRVAVSSISLVTDFSEGVPRIYPIETNRFLHETSFILAETYQTTYGFSIATYLSTGIEESSVAAGVIDMKNPPWRQYWHLSEILPRPGFREPDLSTYEQMDTFEPWINGANGFYAFFDSEPIDKIRPVRDSSVFGGLYFYRTEDVHASQGSLALLGSSSSGVRLMLPIRLDAERLVDELTVSYVVAQARASEVPGTTINFAWAAMDNLEALTGSAIEWKTVETASCVVGPECVRRHVMIPPKQLRHHEYVFFQWSVPRRANSDIVSIGEIRVSGQLHPPGFYFFIR